jgi:hypothetical protein
MKNIFQHFRERWLRYGLETLVVVNGVLIAFALSNWNENRKKEILEIQYLNRLIEDLAIDTSYYNHRSGRSQNVINENRQVILMMYQNQETVEDVKELYSHIRWDTEHLTTQNSTYTELTNSGNLNIFVNQTLTNAIIYYYRENEQAAKGIAEFDEVSTRHLIELGHVAPNNIKFNHHFSDIWKDLPVSKDDWDFFNDPSSEKFQILMFTLAIYKLKHEEYLDYFKTLKDMSTQLILDIQLELESRN